MKTLNSVQDIINKAKILQNEEKFEEAIKLLENLYSQDPQSVMIKKNLIDVLFSYGGYLNDDFVVEYEKAVNIYDKVLEYNPNDNQGVRALAIEANLLMGNYRKILKICKFYPEDTMPDTLYGKFVAYYRLGQKDKAAEILKEANKILPNVPKELLKEKHKEIVITFHEITEIKKTEKFKKDFISNVSHELRTPLTAIKGFIETLLETAKDENKRYLKIIERQTDRLINIVKDLLKLSELEDIGEGKIEISSSKVDLKKLINGVFSIYEKEIKNKGLKSVVKIDKNVPKIKADPFKLEQLFINLIENAIKYTEKGEIRITAKKEDKSVVIEVSDTGTGIARKHLSRIFERFYVVDKSRSKELGGTGLGLSIVKHIVQLHNGEINIESTIGKGTKFTIALPIN